MRNFSLDSRCGFVEELARFQYSLNDKNSYNYRESKKKTLSEILWSHPI